MAMLKTFAIFPFLCVKDLNWDEEKFVSLSIINVLANGNCWKTYETLFSIVTLFGISFAIKYFKYEFIIYDIRIYISIKMQTFTFSFRNWCLTDRNLYWVTVVFVLIADSSIFYKLLKFHV